MKAVLFLAFFISFGPLKLELAFAQAQKSEVANNDIPSGIIEPAFTEAVSRSKLLQFPSFQKFVMEAYSNATPIVAKQSDLKKEDWKQVIYPIAPVKKFLARKDTQSLLRFMAIQHAFRLATEAETREMTFTPRIFSNYWEGIKGIRHMTWEDGDNRRTNVYGHGLQGLTYFMIFWVNGQARFVPIDVKSAKFWKHVFGASWKTALASLYFEFGPFLGETALGGLGGKRHCMSVEKFKAQYPIELEKYRNGERPTIPRNSNCDHGYVDLVFTPAIGTGLALLELLKDGYVVQKLSASKSKTLRVIGMAIGYTNIGTAMAQLMSLQPPTGSVASSTSWRSVYGINRASTLQPQIGVSIQPSDLATGMKKATGFVLKVNPLRAH